MNATQLTPEEFELHLKDLRDRLTAYLERGEGQLQGLHREAEAVLVLADQFPQIYQRYPEVEGMVADMLARERQQEVFGTGAPEQKPGCALGWMLRRRAK
ncbi:MAG: hypothetical protein ACYS8K_00245 [Planctomycetota bacterium]|jgi:hypothetical protein